MSKFTKLIYHPQTFFSDAIRNKKSSISQYLLDASELLNGNNKSEDLATNTTPNTIDDIEQQDLDLEENMATIELKNFFDECLENDEYSDNSETSTIRKRILSNRIAYHAILAVQKYNLNTHYIFNENLIFKQLNKTAALKASIIEKLTTPMWQTDGIEITNLMSHMYNDKSMKSYYDAFDKLINFIDTTISGHAEKVPLLGENNLIELNASAINPRLFDYYLSNFMAYAIFRESESNLDVLKDKDTVYWWWLTYYLPTKKLGFEFIPIEIVSYYKEITFLQEKINIGLPHFYHEAYKQNSLYQSRYNLLEPIEFMGYLLDCYLNNINNEINHIFINSHVESILESIVHEDINGETYNLFDILYYTCTTQDFKLEKVTNECLQLSKLFFIGSLPRLTESAFLNQYIEKNNSHNFIEQSKIRLVGLYHSYTGLGTNLKMMSNTLSKMNISHEIFDINTKNTYQITVPNPKKVNKNCNIFMINADMLPEYIFDVKQENNTVNIGFLLWELEEVPHTHKLALDFLDEIWVPTHYLEKIYNTKTQTPVVCVKKYISLIPPTKKYIKSKKFRFYMSFDFHSNIERKNPLSAVIAFKKAFQNDEPVEFILKTTDIIRNHPGNHKQQWERIIKEISNDKRFKIISGKIPFQDLVNQIYNTECIVSSHRSEGFGYLPAHGFILGKPVILTDYSGTTDFCTSKTAYLVKWHKKQLDENDFGSIVQTGFWADIDIDDLAKKMLAVYKNYPLALSKAQVGKKLIEAEYSFEAFSSNCLKQFIHLGIINV